MANDGNITGDTVGGTKRALLVVAGVHIDVAAAVGLQAVIRKGLGQIQNIEGVHSDLLITVQGILQAQGHGSGLADADEHHNLIGDGILHGNNIIGRNRGGLGLRLTAGHVVIILLILSDAVSVAGALTEEFGVQQQLAQSHAALQVLVGQRLNRLGLGDGTVNNLAGVQVSGDLDSVRRLIVIRVNNGTVILRGVSHNNCAVILNGYGVFTEIVGCNGAHVVTEVIRHSERGHSGDQQHDDQSHAKQLLHCVFHFFLTS